MQGRKHTTQGQVCLKKSAYLPTGHSVSVGALCNALMLELSGNPNILQYSDNLLVLFETQEALDQAEWTQPGRCFISIRYNFSLPNCCTIYLLNPIQFWLNSRVEEL